MVEEELALVVGTGKVRHIHPRRRPPPQVLAGVHRGRVRPKGEKASLNLWKEGGS
jgi:hypothetical protein